MGNKRVLFIVGFVAGAVAVVAVTSAVSSAYLDRGAASKTCPQTRAAHTVFIKDDSAVPAQTSAGKCDTLTFKNTDDGLRLIAFGPHEDHVAYDGVAEKALGPGQSFTITLVQTGTFHFHNHITDGSQGSFTVR